MPFNDLLNIHNVCIDTTSKSKSAVLLALSHKINQCYPELNTQKLFNAYWERESLGSTSIGHGILIPHICMNNIQKTYACFLKLNNPVDCDADDRQPINLVFGLVSATNEPDKHLQTLSRIVSSFQDPEFVNLCRVAKDKIELFNILTKDVILQP
jgi:PTS system nitrogen regulatory IIA component